MVSFNFFVKIFGFSCTPDRNSLTPEKSEIWREIEWKSIHKTSQQLEMGRYIMNITFIKHHKTQIWLNLKKHHPSSGLKLIFGFVDLWYRLHYAKNDLCVVPDT